MSTTAMYPYADPLRTYNFVPDRLCVVTRTTGDANKALAQREMVQQAINKLIVSKLPPQILPPPTTPLEEDLQPTPGLWDKFTYKSMSPLDLDPSSPIYRSVAFAHDNNTATALHFYHVALTYTKPDPAQYWIEKQDRAQTIRDLVKIINGTGAMPAPVSELFTLLAATPDWFTVMAPEDGAGGSPSTPPEAINLTSEPPPLPFFFTNGIVQTLVKSRRDLAAAGGTSNVVVAVVDTCPSALQVQAAVNRFTGNWLLQLVGTGVNKVVVDAPQFVTPADFRPLDEILPNHRGDLQPFYDGTKAANEFASPDHGLFVAGIIKDIAPEAEIHIVRALSDTGMGSLQTIAHVLDQFMTWKKANKAGKHLIVNMSLSADVPGDGVMLPQWLPKSAATPSFVNASGQLIDAVLDQAHRSLHEVMDWLDEQDVLVVAAAGNNALGAPPSGNGIVGSGTNRPEPTVPARYPHVVSVAAINREGAASAFSNEGEEAPDTNGIAALGGDGRLVSSPPHAENVPLGGCKRDAVRGILSAVDIPFQPPSANGTTIGNGTNTIGFVYWSGTSFATPIATGIAADIWAQNPMWHRPDVTKELYTYAKIPIPALKCSAIDANQDTPALVGIGTPGAVNPNPQSLIQRLLDRSRALLKRIVRK